MTYLNETRLHFAGRFQANVSTINNDPAHFDNAMFQQSDQDMQQPGHPNGWFNPQGDAAWRLLGCRVRSAHLPSGAVSDADPVLHCLVADSDTLPPAKLVDLDSQQQMVSEIWGLQVRIADADGNTLMCGDFAAAAFSDIWARAAGRGSDVNACAMYQSVLTNLEWSDVSASPFLSALQAAAPELLSIKFNVDGINMDFKSPDFMTGRMVGTIGPATPSEPRHLVIGRQFMADPAPTPSFFSPQGRINFCAAVVDEASSCVYLDLGNALPTTTPGGPPLDVGDLTLTAGSGASGGTNVLGTIPAGGVGGYIQDPDWYQRTAGVVALPLTANQLTQVASSPLTLAGNSGVVIQEWSSGAFVRADRFVYRLSPGETVEIPVHAMQFGRPLIGTKVGFALDSSQLQSGGGVPVATPTAALTFVSTATTDANGCASLSVTAGDPGAARNFNSGQDFGIDGQIYGIRPAFAAGAGHAGPDNDLNFISFLVWSGFEHGNPITWTDVQPIFQQYANLYPVMNRFLQLDDYDSVVANADLLLLAFGLDAANPNAMPVTRDLSPARRDAILTWLEHPMPGPVSTPSPRAATNLAAGGSAPSVEHGGKAAAMARRQILQVKGDES